MGFFNKIKKSIIKRKEERQKRKKHIENLLDDYVVAEEKDETVEKFVDLTETYPEVEEKIQKIAEAKVYVEKEAQYLFKVCIFGDGDVGKTTLLHRYYSNKFEDSMKMTIGADIGVKILNIDGKKIKLQIWDFGGQDQFRVFFQYFFKGANGSIFMYDITRKSSLMNIDVWLNDLKTHASTDKDIQIPILMVGGKTDLEDKRVVTPEEAMKLQKSHNLHAFFECSSKTGQNVNVIFETLTHAIMKNQGYS